MRAIVISGMPATGKTTVATILAKELKVPNIGGGEILKEMAVERGYTPGGENWWDTDEGKRFVKERESNPNFDKEVDVKIIEKIKNGDIIITSYTAPWLTKEGFNIWLKATDNNRAERMSSRDHTDMKQTKETLKFRDKENKYQYDKLYNIKLGEDLTPFDFIVDTNGVPAVDVAEIILKKIKELNL